MLRELGRLQMEVAFLKKNAGVPVNTHLAWIDEYESLSIANQCDLLGVARSTWYYKPLGSSQWEDMLMRRLDRLYTDLPFYGVRRMVAELSEAGLSVGPKLILRLLREMGLMAIYPKPRLSLPEILSGVFPTFCGVSASRDQGQLGWVWALSGQCFCGKPLADG